jgi:MFS family permease
MTVPDALRALEHRHFRRYFVGHALSMVGGTMQMTAVSWLVLQLTHSPFKLGLMSTLTFGPFLLLAVVVGAAADRLPRRRMLLAAQSVLAVQAVALAALAWSGRIQYWHMAALALIGGVAGCVDMPTRHPFVADLVGRDDLASAVALHSIVLNVARIVGPALAGLVIVRHGITPALVAGVLGVLVLVAGLLSTPVRAPGPRERGATVGRAIREGVRYALVTPRIRQLLAVLLVVALAVPHSGVVVPLLASHLLGAGAETYGFLMAALGAGAVCGALASARRRAGPRPRVVLGAALLSCAGLGLLGLARAFWPAAALLYLVGFASIVVVTACSTELQLVTPDGLRGRVMSLHTLVLVGVVPVGALVFGALAEVHGVRTALFVAGAAGGLGVAAVGLGGEAARP